MLDDDIHVTIDATGALQFIYRDDLQSLLTLGDAHVTRASHVEANAQCQWEADMSPVGGPMLGPFVHREEALRAETDWLRKHRGL